MSTGCGLCGVLLSKAVKTEIIGDVMYRRRSIADSCSLSHYEPSPSFLDIISYFCARMDVTISRNAYFCLDSRKTAKMTIAMTPAAITAPNIIA